MSAELTPPGTVIVFTMGDYSSYGIVALMRVLRPLDLRDDAKAVYAEWKAEVHGRRGKKRPDVLAWLVTTGRCEELPIYAYHLPG